MADAVTTFSSLSQDAPNVWIAAKMIELLDRILVIPKIAEAYPLENRNSKTLRANRFRRLTLPNTPLTEGVTPNTLALEVESQEVTVEQWGIVTAHQGCMGRSCHGDTERQGKQYSKHD